MSVSDVCIVGGGIIGLTTAYQFAEAGARVAVFDRSAIATEASWAGAGILPPGNPDRATHPRDWLRAFTVSRFAEFSKQLQAQTGIDSGYRRCGLIDTDVEDAPLEKWRAEGIRFERIETHPFAGVKLPGPAWYFPDGAQIRNPRYLRALAAGCVQMGVRFFPHEPLCALEYHGERVAGIQTAHGSHACENVVIAAGSWTTQLLAEYGLAIPTRPVLGQIVLLKSKRALELPVIEAGLQYVVFRGGVHVLVGSTEEPETGFTKRNVLQTVSDLKQFAARWVPELQNAEVERAWSGLRPGTPDGLPTIDRLPGFRNAVVAYGHYRSGIQTSLGTARLIFEMIYGGPTSVDMTCFALNRNPACWVEGTFRS
jgi:glycine oxidase